MRPCYLIEFHSDRFGHLPDPHMVIGWENLIWCLRCFKNFGMKPCKVYKLNP